MSRHHIELHGFRLDVRYTPAEAAEGPYPGCAAEVLVLNVSPVDALTASAVRGITEEAWLIEMIEACEADIQQCDADAEIARAESDADAKRDGP